MLLLGFCIQEYESCSTLSRCSMLDDYEWERYCLCLCLCLCWSVCVYSTNGIFLLFCGCFTMTSNFITNERATACMKYSANPSYCKATNWRSSHIKPRRTYVRCPLKMIYICFCERCCEYFWWRARTRTCFT